MTDDRRRRLEAWSEARLGRVLSWTPVSVDASSRRYFRARATVPGAGPSSWIAADAPPERENNTAFVAIAERMAAIGLNVPRVEAFAEDHGFLLLSDLGDRTFLDVLDTRCADALFDAAIGALLDWQAASRPNVLPDYDRATLYREMALFPEWYIERHLGLALGARETADIEAAFAAVLDNVCAQPQVFVHRDYMPRNLMLSTPLPGILDFQDARFGPVTYDVASLFRDAFISWPEARIRSWVGQYWEAAQARGIPVGDDWSVFRRDLALMGAQRHLKILGLFARIAYRDGKPKYLADTPRFLTYLRPVIAAEPALAPLAAYMRSPSA